MKKILGKAYWPFIGLLALLSVSQAAADEHGTGYIKDAEEVYLATPPVSRHRAFLPPTWDLSAGFPKPGSQGQQGSCTAWATGYALRSYYEGKRQGWDLNQPDHLFSPAFIYNKLHPGAKSCDDGTTISGALALLKDNGVPSLADFPYEASDCSRDPGNVAAIAQQFKIADWKRFETSKVDDIKGQIHAGNPVVFGLDISKSFHDVKGDQIYDDTSSPRTGGHAMVLVGYSDEKQAFKLINSWGTHWGDGGFGWVSYEAFKKFCDRAYVILPPAVSPPKPVIAVADPVVAPPKPEPVLTPVVPPPPKPEPVVVPVVIPPPKPQPVVPVVVPPKPEPVVVPPRPVAMSVPQIQAKVAEVLRGAECASLQGSVGTDRTVALRGFIGSKSGLERIQASIGALPGVKQVSAEVALRPWPQCEAMLTFADALANGQGLGIKVRGDAVLADGDKLVVEVNTPAYPSYLYVTYLQASGDAVHLSRPVGRVPKAFAPNTKVVLGEGQQTYRVGGPFGDEMIVVIAAKSPLFAEDLPDAEIEREYLTNFRKAFLEKPTPGAPKRVVSAAFATLTTRAK